MNVHLQEYLPCDALCPYVERFWTGRFTPLHTAALAQRVVPNGFLEIIIHLTDHHCDLPGVAGYGQSPDYTLVGLQSAAYEVRFTREVEVFAVRFKPAGFFTLFGVPAGEAANAHEDLEAMLGGSFRDFADRIREGRGTPGRLRVAERYLLRAVGCRDLTYLNRAAELIRASGGRLRVAEVADRCGISPRQLERAFKQALGLSPKQYLRVARLNLAQRLFEEGAPHGLADLAFRAGYSDQAHLNREFKRMVGEVPSLFLADRPEHGGSGLRRGGRAAAHL